MSASASWRRSTAARSRPRSAGSSPAWCSQVRDPERDVPGLVDARQPGDLPGDRVGRVVVEERQQRQEAALAEHREQERGQREVGLGEQRRQRRPATHRRACPSRPPCSSARRVNTSMWRASSAACTASSCWTSRKCGCTRAEQPGRDDERGLLVLDQVGHHLDDGGLDRRAAVRRRASQSTAVAGSHCAAAAWAYSRGARSAQTTSRSARSNAACGAARLDQRAAGGEAPVRGRAPRRSRPGRVPPARSRPAQRCSSARPARPGRTRRSGRAAKPWPAPRGTTRAGARPAPGRCRVTRSRAARRGTARSARSTSRCAPVVEAQAAEVERRRLRSRRVLRGGHLAGRRRRSRPRRRRASSGPYPLVRPSCQTRRPSRSSSGRTSGSA